MSGRIIVYFVVMLAILLGNGSCNGTFTLSGISPCNFIRNTDEGNIDFYILKNYAGTEICLSNYGARIISIVTKNKYGKPTDVTLGFDNIDDYININRNFGATIGRYANRIENASFQINGSIIQLQNNDGKNCLHGGYDGWQGKIFNVSNVTDSSVTFSYTSVDGEGGFPGCVKVDVEYHLSYDNELGITYYATTDRTTVVNLTNHTFFNLSGNPENTVLDHILYLNSDKYIPLDSTLTPMKSFESVDGTPMNFSRASIISEKYDTIFSQIIYARGYDHNWILKPDRDIDQPAASLYSPCSGIIMDVYTDQPGIQVFTGNAFNGSFTGRKGIAYKNHPSICLETQHYPDSPNHPDWPSTILEPGSEYKSTTIYKFSVADDLRSGL